MNSLTEDIKSFIQAYPQREQEGQRAIDLITKVRDRALYRDCYDDGHFVGSLFVFSPDKKKILLMHHVKLDKWLQFGGHADGNPDLLDTALREFEEESGISEPPALISREIIDIDIHEIPTWWKEPEHLHYDVRYAATIPEDATINYGQREAHDVRWIHIDGLQKYTQEQSVLGVVRLITGLS